MADIEPLLNRWQTAGVLDAETAARIRAHEAQLADADGGEPELLAERRAAHPTSQKRDVGHPARLSGTPEGRDERVPAQQARAAGMVKWQGITALILGAILLACGVVLFVSAHWDEMGSGARLALVMAMVAVFHIGGGIFRPNDEDRWRRPREQGDAFGGPRSLGAPGVVRENYRGLSTALHAVGTVATGAAIALVGQIFNIEEHWPAAILLWALAALAGWALLHDQAQQTLTLLLAPAWIFCEIGYRANGYIGDTVYMGRLCLVCAVLYITFFLGSRLRAVQGILFGVSVIGAVAGITMMLGNWQSWSAQQSLIPFSTRMWAWTAIVALPLIIAAFHGHKGLIPVAAAIAFCVALPWCYRTWTESYLVQGMTTNYVRSEPNLLANVLVAAFAVFLCWWGVRQVSRALVNLGIVGFAATVAWFYFSDLMSKLGRSLGLIGLGILFLAGGWALEKVRRRILSQMPPGKGASMEPNGGAL